MAIMEQAVRFVESVFAGDAGGHDCEHTMRVYRMAVRIAGEEGADASVVGLAALLHDVDDRKLSPQTCENKSRAAAFLESQGLPESQIRQILRIIAEVSFSGHPGPADSVEGRCVQDADRLDAMGAIGIARAFAYGGSRGRAMHDPKGMDPSTSVMHFYDKLLRLEGLMTTETGRRIAHDRHTYMVEYLDRFYREWEGSC